MNNHVTYIEIVDRLKENNLDYEVLNFTEDLKIIITKIGGRIFGPFFKNGESIFWVNKAFKETSSFKDFLYDKDWNLGAERFWVAPEFPFFNKQRLKFDETYTVQQEIDPGNYTISRINERIVLENEVTVPVFEMPFSEKSFNMKRNIYPAVNPLNFLDSMKDVHTKYCGFHQQIALKDTSLDNKMPLESWILSQINPGGFLLVPYLGEFEFVDYYDPINEDVLKVYKDYAKVKVCGQRKFKVAFKSANTFGRSCYVNKYNDESYYVVIKNYNNDPSNQYSCEPWHSKGEKGCSLYIYNDGGDLGGFAEFEHSGMTIGENDINESCDNFTQWFYMGDKDEIEKVIKALLGIKYEIDF